ncbi:PE-PPE domain-containing protein [Mycolicibacterium austroafricanum]|uniref:PE-PPE domain-containing protein n=1 Tax=Mycolicibacterium austroafricanum TaxID=39687 RepID=UPI001CA30667|nr:PE-PPE domain-containing protein [Mycolicibacterium austroafricanum]QZT63582.1 PE-PPE domain-containing protein [Mycolicibacterium austroafricanum]
MSTDPPAEAPSQQPTWRLEYAEPGMLVYSIPGVELPKLPLVRSGGWVPGGAPSAEGLPDKHSALHYARYIGRVGVLAAALGLGAVIAGTPGIARAEPEADSTTSSSTASDASEASEAVATDQEASETEEASESEDALESDTGETATEDDAEAEAEAEADAEAEAAAEAEADAEAEAEAEGGTADEDETARASGDAVEQPTATTEYTGGSTTEPAMLIPAPPDVQSPTDTEVTTGSPAVSAETDTTAPAEPTPQPAPTGAVRQALDTVLAPLAAPERPAVQRAETPVLWTVFAWTRRTFFNATPVVRYDDTTTSQLQNTITGRVTATDSDTPTLTLTASAPANGGTVLLRPDGTFTYTVPTTMYAGGTDTFTVTASDADGPAHIHGLTGLLHLVSLGLVGHSGHSATATVTLDIAAVTAPILGTPAYQLDTAEHGTGAVPGALHVTGPEGLTYTLTGGPAEGEVTLDARTGAFIYTPTSVARHQASAEDATPDELADTFTITVTDNLGGTISVPVAVAIDPSNQSPTVTLVVSVPDSEGTVHVSVAVADPDNDATTYFVVHDPAYGTLTATPDGYDYNPTAEAVRIGVRADTLTVTASDLHHGSDTETVTVPIGSDDAAPAGLLAATAYSSTDIQLPAAATVITLRGRNYLGSLSPDRMDDHFGGMFAEDPYTMVKLTYPDSENSDAIDDAVAMLDAQLMSTPGDIIVMGHSFGAQVCSRWMRVYARDPVRTAMADRLTFLLTGNPLRSDNGKVVGMLEIDAWIGLPTPTTTPWQIIDVARRWDGWADWPDDSSNATAARNARAGQTYLHPHYDDVDLYDPQNTVWRNGNTTYVLTHEDDLPMFRYWWGVPSDFESVVRAEVESAYNRPSADIPVPVRPVKSWWWQMVLRWLEIENPA